jgi:biotin carboxyl carrier protein
VEGVEVNSVSPEYKVTIDERPYEVEVKMLDEGGVLVVTVGDQSFTMKPTPMDDGTWIVNDLTTDYSVKVLKRAGRIINLEINGEEREIEWERQRKIETVKKTTGASQSGPRVAGGVYPPMPGKITEVRVNVGDKVKAGDTVCILEAMKMFNELKADSSGKVKEVNVDIGTMVTTADLLILIE